MCDAAIAAGEAQAKEDLRDTLTKMTFLYSDAIIAAAEEVIDGTTGN